MKLHPDNHDKHGMAPSVVFNHCWCCGRTENFTSVEDWKIRGSWSVGCVLVPSSLEETCCPCVFTGEELCMGLKRGCTLNCPFGFLTDAYGCEICQCRPRPRKCRPVVCEKHCPFGYLYVFLNQKSSSLLSVTWRSVLPIFGGCFCVFVNKSVTYWSPKYLCLFC